MTIIKTTIKGLEIVTLEVHVDDRGYVIEIERTTRENSRFS